MSRSRLFSLTGAPRNRERQRAISWVVTRHQLLRFGPAGEHQDGGDDESAEHHVVEDRSGQHRADAGPGDVRVVHQGTEGGVQQHRAATSDRDNNQRHERRTPAAVPAEAGEVADQRQDEGPPPDLVVRRRHEVGGQAGGEPADQPEAGPVGERQRHHDEQQHVRRRTGQRQAGEQVTCSARAMATRATASAVRADGTSASAFGEGVRSR